jgi:Xaa-Pro aminopeptidase
MEPSVESVLRTSRERVDRIQVALKEEGFDGWLFYDFRGSNPIAERVLLLTFQTLSTRRWYYFVPARGEPKGLVSRVEPHRLDSLPGEKIPYLSWAEQKDSLRSILSGSKRVSMEYSPFNAIPTISRVDAGTLELVRSFGVEVVSSQDLVQRFEAVWSSQQFGSHLRAAEVLSRTVQDTFAWLGERLSNGQTLTEYDIQQEILRLFEERGLYTDSPPIAAVNDHSADPHYEPSASSSSRIGVGDFLLIDLWAKEREESSVYADTTWTAFAGESVPQRHISIFRIVQIARDRAIDFVFNAIRQGEILRGWQVDRAARNVIDEAGYGPYFIHRTGHSIGIEDHGNGANIDGLEVHDERRLIPNTCFSIEPGIYLPGQFGIRSEVNVFLGHDGIRVTPQPVQTEVVPLLSGSAGPSRS